MRFTWNLSTSPSPRPRSSQASKYNEKTVQVLEVVVSSPPQNATPLRSAFASHTQLVLTTNSALCKTSQRNHEIVNSGEKKTQENEIRLASGKIEIVLRMFFAFCERWSERRGGKGEEVERKIEKSFLNWERARESELHLKPYLM